MFHIKGEDGVFRPRHCDLETLGGGWSLVAHASTAQPFPTPSLGFADHASTGVYDEAWPTDSAFVASFTNIPHDSILLKTNDGRKWCVLVASDLQKPNTDREARTARILASHGTSLTAGERTNHLLDQGQLTLGCEGSAAENLQQGLLWADGHGSSPETDLKQAHGGVSVYVRVSGEQHSTIKIA